MRYLISSSVECVWLMKTLANKPRWQMTLRGWADNMRQYDIIFGMLGVIAILSILGPFGTNDNLGLIERTVCWFSVSFSTCEIRNYFHIARFTPTTGNILLKWAVATCAASTQIDGLVIGKNIGFSNHPPKNIGNIFPMLTIYLSTSVIYMLARLKRRPKSDNPKRINLMDLLPHNVREKLISLKTLDNRGEVTLNTSKQIVLVRFSDALSKISEGIGIKVTQSHLLKKDKIDSGKRQGGYILLCTDAKLYIPAVSKSTRKVVRFGASFA